jgi:hypothetical protein
MICVQNGSRTQQQKRTETICGKLDSSKRLLVFFALRFFLPGVAATYSPTSQSLSLLVLQQAAIEFYS